MKRLAFLFAGGALWLFVAALPALADGGPHVQAYNNGSAGLTSDNCAGCHRAHIAQFAFLLKEEEPALCISCHGTAGTGATTNVADGVQYTLAGDGSRTTTELGALRGGGFVNARIDSASPTRKLLSFPAAPGTGFAAFIAVTATGQAVTSAHLNVTTPGTSTAWGNGALNSGAGATGVSLECTSCHNPHGNGQYRILNPIPEPLGGTGFVAAGTGVTVTDAALPGPGEVRNYTVQPGLTADAVSGSPDYWRRCVPWDSCDAGRGDKPNGLATFRLQISAWCASCHTRYLAGAGSASYEGGPSSDPIFAFRHTTSPSPECTQCHVAHGSNAQMTGFNSSHQANPGAGSDPTSTLDADSRLLKVDNRGTCQLCHDPTGTITVVGAISPAP